ncbi:N-acetyltransferase [Chitinophaga silvatica]|uniref:N-acetyltransferase n=1 Tax=Chitinophaga silvatica TaxID=2282649 RepID=A0A3E1Y5X5_9BACT|nr:GNAT family N-acetyltransferase [Chitinophaga silvatica]RFS20138.1 N-acetyltransferase [Chitinophaga silvatica]
MITYQIEEKIEAAEFLEVLVKSTLGERRPINEPDRIAKMLQNADIFATARDNGKLIGIARSLTDYAFCTYLSDLAVDESYQKMGIGRELIRITKQHTPDAKLILLAAPKAIHYYPKIGMEQWEYCYTLTDVNNIK